MKKLKPKESGFGLLEVVLASAILALVVGAATGLVRSSLRRTVLALDRTVAMNLAQESIEQLRSARDSTFIDGATNAWDANLPVTDCDGDVLHPDPSCQSFVISQASGVWSVQQGSAQSIPMNGRDFTREIYISVPNGYAANAGLLSQTDQDVVRRVHVIVRWDNNTQAVESATYFTNWRSGV